MANCAIPNCFTSRNEKYKGISLFKIPGGKGEYSMKWSKELLNIITKYRIIDTKLRKLIESKRLYICERHYLPNQIIHRKYIMPL